MSALVKKWVKWMRKEQVVRASLPVEISHISAEALDRLCNRMLGNVSDGLDHETCVEGDDAIARRGIKRECFGDQTHFAGEVDLGPD